MAKMQLKYFPDKILKQKAKKVSQFDSSLRKLAADMLDTMYESDGVGLAAPQVGVSKQIMIIDVSRRSEEHDEENCDHAHEKEDNEPAGPIIFINPTGVKKEGEMVGLEGCLSFP